MLKTRVHVGLSALFDSTDCIVTPYHAPKRKARTRIFAVRWQYDTNNETRFVCASTCTAGMRYLLDNVVEMWIVDMSIDPEKPSEYLDMWSWDRAVTHVVCSHRRLRKFVRVILLEFKSYFIKVWNQDRVYVDASQIYYGNILRNLINQKSHSSCGSTWMQWD